jgi:hypothetical protein
MLHVISSYTSSIVAVVWASVIKSRKFLEILENISEVDNKLRYTPQEETRINRKVRFNIILEIYLLTALQCDYMYSIASRPLYNIVIGTINRVSDICNTLMFFQFVNLVFMMKQRYSHLNKSLSNWINGKVSRPICLDRQNERRSQSDRADDSVIVTSFCVSSVGNIEGTLRLTDIHSLRQIYSEQNDITCLINDTYGIPILATVCWILTGVVLSLYTALVHFNERRGEYVTYGVSVMVLFFNVTFFVTQLRTKQGLQEF